MINMSFLTSREQIRIKEIINIKFSKLSLTNQGQSVRRFEPTSLAASSCDSDNAMASCNSSSSSSRISCSDFLAGTYKQVRVQHMMTQLSYQLGSLKLTLTFFRDFIRSQAMNLIFLYLLSKCKLPATCLSFIFSYAHYIFLFAQKVKYMYFFLLT